MTRKEMDWCLRGRTQRDLAALLDVSERTMRRYVADPLMVPRVVTLALRHLFGMGIPL